MFTGIIEEVGTVRRIERVGSSCVLQISCDEVLQGTKIGDSISTNGVCLTVTNLSDKMFAADVMPETLRRSSLGSLKSNDMVNLERALLPTTRLGGHIVSGHIDGCGTIAGIREEGNAYVYTIEASPEILMHIVEKGSVAIEGISLTVTFADTNMFGVSVIPHTRSNTNICGKRISDLVNIECDVLGKYVQRLAEFEGDFGLLGDGVVGTGDKKPVLTEEFLRQNGF